MAVSKKIKTIDIEDSWYAVLKEEIAAPNFQGIKDFLEEEITNGKCIFPPVTEVYNAFNSCPFEKVKIVILGQDPYHRAGQAMGLSFSVPTGVRVPPSLKNIYKELASDTDFDIPDHGDLSAWAVQGVFLLNAMLTVEEGKAGSHKKIGWQTFTDTVIQKLSDQREGLIFMLWGNFAKNKRDLIDTDKHIILEAAHPSPLARKAFFGCKHFSRANQILIDQGQTPIQWQI